MRTTLAILFAAIVVHDFAAPPAGAFGAQAALFAIGQYRSHVSPHLSGIVRCRFTPTCSVYGQESIRKHGLLVGGLRTAWRIARCTPWTKMGTVDPP
ncbi:MAG TPA: membrane protein insertion efficiency factor YidD [Thermoanaerobaculia bacterium]|nr:membrane protein insertion efficiency factor YidD [Thermoanaerobaculia bacterium]